MNRFGCPSHELNEYEKGIYTKKKVTEEKVGWDIREGKGIFSVVTHIRLWGGVWGKKRQKDRRTERQGVGLVMGLIQYSFS